MFDDFVPKHEIKHAAQMGRMLANLAKIGAITVHDDNFAKYMHLLAPRADYSRHRELADVVKMEFDATLEEPLTVIHVLGSKRPVKRAPDYHPKVSRAFKAVRIS